MTLFRKLLMLALLCNTTFAWGIDDPTEVGGLLQWVDARDVNGNGMQPADSSVVSTWADKSGNGNNLTTAAGTVTFESSGFDAVNPGLRFPFDAQMTGANPFSSIRHNQITLFVVSANVTITNNFAVSLNGNQTGTGTSDGRFSLHAPWTNNNIYFDAGACCGSTRLSGPHPNALTETTLYTALSDQPGSRQWLRIDGQSFRSDTTGLNANVSRGVSLGDIAGGHKYNGRFAEFVLYDRALSLVETQAVECYLMNKWKPDDAPAHCSPPPTDFSDAPSSYGNPSHVIDSNIKIGASVTAESTAYNDTNATADVDDGVSIPTLTRGENVSITVEVAGTGARLSAWVDWNGNGSYEVPAEQIATDLQDPGAGVITIPVTVPANAVTTQTFARFRWSTESNITPVGAAVDGEVEDYSITPVIADLVLSGTIFLDNGAGAGTAHNSMLDGAEPAGSYAAVTVEEVSSGILIATATVNVSGSWSATLPSGYSGAIEVKSLPVDGYLSVSEATGNLSGVVNQSQIDGAYVATVAQGVSYDGLNIGVVKVPNLSESQRSTIRPGRYLDLLHNYVASSSAIVSFSVVDQVQLPPDEFSAVLFHDSDCDGDTDSVLQAPVSVVVDQVVCVIIRTHAKRSLGTTRAHTYGSHTYGVTAQTQFSNSLQISSLRNDDDIRLKDAQLTLNKTVRNVSTAGVESTTNTGSVGDILEYRIVMQNHGTTSLHDVSIRDSTPDFTELSAAIPSPVVVTTGVECAVVTPIVNVTGYTGEIEWYCPGSFVAGAIGTLTFQVKIQ